MKKLYKKGTVHPTPPLILDQLSFLPATILTLTAALSIEDREVLAYLLSCSSNNYACNKKNIHKNTTTSSTINRSSSSGGGAQGGAGDHPPSFNCSCFRCYMSYWVRWDASPNRQLIHEIIDAFEEGLTMQGKKEKTKKERRKSRGNSNRGSGEFKKSDLSLNKDEFSESDSVEESSTAAAGGSNSGGGGQSSSGEDEGEEEGLEKGSVRRFVSFLGEKIWSVWNK